MTVAGKGSRMRDPGGSGQAERAACPRAHAWVCGFRVSKFGVSQGFRFSKLKLSGVGEPEAERSCGGETTWGRRAAEQTTCPQARRHLPVSFGSGLSEGCEQSSSISKGGGLGSVELNRARSRQVCCKMEKNS